MLLPVRSKDDFKGKHFEVLIDDTDPDYQGFYADISMLPFQSFDDKEFVVKAEEKMGQAGNSRACEQCCQNPADTVATHAVVSLKEALGTESTTPQRELAEFVRTFQIAIYLSPYGIGVDDACGG